MAKSITIEVDLDSKGAVSGLKAVDGAFNILDKQVKKTDKAMKGIWKQFAVGAVVSKAVNKGIQLVTDSFKAGVKSVIDFEKEFANVTTLLDDSGPVESMRNDILNLAGQLGSAGELTKGLYQALSAGQKPADAVKFVGEAAKFAKAGLVDMTASVDVLTTVLNAYGLEAEQVTDVSDVLFQVIKDGKITGEELASSLGRVIPSAATLGISLREVGAAMAVMTKSGIKSEEAVTSLNATMMAIIKPSTEAIKTAKQYGIELSKIAVEKAGGLQKWLAELKDKIGDNEKAMASLFPNIRALKAVFTLTGKGAKEYADEMERMANVAGNTAEAFAKQKKSFAFVWDGIKNKMEAVLIKFLLPVLKDIATWLNNNQDMLINTFKGILDGVKEFGKGALTVFKIVGKGIKLLLIPQIVKALGLLKDLSDEEGKNIKSQKARVDILDKVFIAQMNVADAIKESVNVPDEDLIDVNLAFKEVVKNSESAQQTADGFNKVMDAMGKGDYGDEVKKIVNSMDLYGLSTKKAESATKKIVKTADKLKDAISDIDKIGNKNTSTVKKNVKEVEKLEKTYLELLPPLKDTVKSIKEYAPAIEEVTDKTEDVNKVTKEASTLFENIQSAVFGAIDIFKSFGLISDKTADTLGNIANAGFQAFEAFTKGDLSDKINAVANALVVAGEAIKKFLFGDGVGEAIERENAWMDITEEQTEKLRELEEQLDSTHAATSVMLDELMDGQVTLENSDKWLYRIRETLSDVEQGTLSATDAVKAMGKSFDVWLKQAKKLGTTGSKVFFDMVGDLRNRGLEVVEINDFILDSIKQGFEGYKQYLEGDFSDATIGVFEDMLAWEKKIADNQVLIDGIKGLENALFGMSDAIRLNEDQFDQFEKATRDGFDELIAKDFERIEALNMMAPTLQRLQYLQKEFGLTVDDSTQALIDEAAGLGLLKADPIERMATAMERFIELLSKQLGLVTENTTNDFKKLNKEVEKLGKNIIDIGGGNVDFSINNNVGKKVPGFADGTDWIKPPSAFTVGERGPELMEFNNGRMKVTPGSTTNNNSQNISVNMYPEAGANRQDLMREFIAGIRNNDQDVNSEIETARLRDVS